MQTAAELQEEVKTKSVNLFKVDKKEVEVGKEFLHYYDKEARYYRVEVTKYKKGAKECHIKWIEYPQYRAFKVSIDELEPGIIPHINQRFELYEELCHRGLTGTLAALLVSGQSGVGKSYILEQMINKKELVEHVPEMDEQGLKGDYIRVSGHISPMELYKLLHDHQHDRIIFDDCDSVFGSEVSNNILKAILDTTGKRRVSWITKDKIIAPYPKSFEFKGSVIFLTNYKVSDLNEALITRSIVINLYMTPDEIIDRMEDTFQDECDRIEMDYEQGQIIFDIIKRYRYIIPNLSLRTLTLNLKTFNDTGNLRLCRYQILQPNK